MAYVSSKFMAAEVNYTTGEQELLGIIKALREWRCYLEGCQGLTLVTDHHPLTFLKSQPNLSRRQARWVEFLSRFEFMVKHRPGAGNPADPLSRLAFPAATVVLAVTMSELSSDLLARIKAGYSSDPNFQKPAYTRKFKFTHDVWMHQGRIVVPTCMRPVIMAEHHASRVAGHFGVSRTEALLSRHFYWPGMQSDLKSFIAACPECQANKASRQRPQGLLNPLEVPDTRWHTVTMDFITDLPESTNGHDSILVMVDKLSKYVHLAPTTKSCTALDCANLFVEHIFQHHGMPKVLISDRDTRFTSEFWSQFCKRLAIDSRYSTAFHPQTDGQTERANQVVEDVLRHFIDGTHTSWEELLPVVAFAMNNAKSASSEHTPFFLNYGAHPHTPMSLAASIPGVGIPSLGVVLNHLEETLSRVKLLLVKAQDRQKTYADQSRRPHSFTVGQKVLLSTKNIKFKTGVRKLHPRYVGPFTITAAVGKNAFKLDLPNSYRIHPVFHVSMLKTFHEGSAIPAPPVPEIIDGELYYKVDRILADRVVKSGRKKRREFLIQWLGYDSTHNSWEPQDNLTPDLVDAYDSK